MDIRLNIGMRCGRRQNDAAYHHHRPTIVADPSQTDKRLSSIGVTWSTNALGGMFLTLWIARLPLSHGPIVLRSPVNGGEAPMQRFVNVQRDVMRLPELEEFRRLHRRRSTPFPPNLAFLNPNLIKIIWTQGF